MTTIERADPPYEAEERTMLVAWLEYHRATLEQKCEGLTDDQLRMRSVPPSTLSLLGLVRHMAKVEHSWFRRVLEQQDLPRLYFSEDDRDLDFNGAVGDDTVVAEAWEAWWREVVHARKVYEELDLDTTVPVHGEATETRDIIVHMVEEYARHVGHADLLRECIDGRTGQ